MKKCIISFFCGCILCSMFLLGISVFAESQTTISAIFGRVKLIVNGEYIDEDTLLYNGTTYLPIRAVGQSLGKNVTFDNNTKIAYINDVSSTATNAEITEENIVYSNDISEQEAINEYMKKEVPQFQVTFKEKSFAERQEENRINEEKRIYEKNKLL